MAKTPTKQPRRKPNTSAQLLDALSQLKQPTFVQGEAKVGIRNISSYTIGLKSPFKDEPDVQLSGERYYADEPTRAVPDVTSTATISHKWWMALRRDKQVAKGMIVRDDSVLSAGAMHAPADEPSDIPESFHVNAIYNAFEWIESKSDKELRAAIEKLTAEESLRRLLTAVNQRITYERQQLSDDTPEREEVALSNLPLIYKLCEELVIAKLEREFYGKYEGR